MAEGDIGAVVDSLEFDTGACSTPKVLRISGTVYAIVYQGVDLDGFIVTVNIAADGTLDAAVIDSWEFDAINGKVPDIIHVDGDVYAIVYGGDLVHGYIITVNIAANGAITKAVIDSLEYDTVLGETPKILNVGPEVFAIAFQGAANDGYIKTVGINATGMISAAVIDNFMFDAAAATSLDFIHISGTVYAIAYTGVAADGWLKTVNISTGGDIGAAIIDALEFDIADGQRPKIVHVSGTVYAIAYTGVGADGYVATVNIATDGTLDAAVIDSWEFWPGDSSCLTFIHVSGSVYAIAYQDSSFDGQLVTINIAANGAITKTAIDTLEFDIADCRWPWLIHVSGSIYAIAYEGVLGAGWLKTVDIETILVSAAQHLMIIGVG